MLKFKFKKTRMCFRDYPNNEVLTNIESDLGKKNEDLQIKIWLRSVNLYKYSELTKRRKKVLSRPFFVIAFKLPDLFCQKAEYQMPQQKMAAVHFI